MRLTLAVLATLLPFSATAQEVGRDMVTLYQSPKVGDTKP
jgi:hypothetical protein